MLWNDPIISSPFLLESQIFRFGSQTLCRLNLKIWDSNKWELIFRAFLYIIYNIRFIAL